MNTKAIDSNAQLYKIQFRFSLGKNTDPDLSKLLYVYRAKWSTLMKVVLKNRSFHVYDFLPELRKLITNDTKVVDLLNYSQVFDVDEFRLLLDAQPLFNISPVDLKVFILACMGLRPYHLQKPVENIQ